MPHRLRLDPRSGDPKALGPAHSGRRFVLIGAAALLLAWAGLYLVFRDWRARHRALAEFGRIEVATAVAPLADISPPDVDPAAWRRAVADTRAMLVAVTGAGLLDRPKMATLRDELHQRVAASRPGTAVATLRAIWDDMERRAGPVLLREYERPPHPPRRPDVLKDHSRREAKGAKTDARRINSPLPWRLSWLPWPPGAQSPPPTSPAEPSPAPGTPPR